MPARVLIVAKTRRGRGACVGGITWEGRSVRLVPAAAAASERAGLEYNVGEVWEIEGGPELRLVPPHIENWRVDRARRLETLASAREFILRHLPPAAGGVGVLFEGRLQAAPSGALYISEAGGLPSSSTMFWIPDQALRLESEGKRLRYRHPSPGSGCTLTFVGFQEPLEVIPAGTLVRVSLAHWWRPKERPEEELRCYAQLSGWFLDGAKTAATEDGRPSATAGSGAGAGVEAGANVGSVGEGAHAASAPDLGQARSVLRETFGFRGFLPLQEQVIGRVLRGEDALAVMPTGGGKSLCYQLPALLFEGLTVVVSPLIALMQDQVFHLRELGIPGAFLNSTLAHRDYLAVARRARRSEVKILYVAPETLLRPETLLLLEQSRVAVMAVDEAHCISEWGHDFRPEYRQLDIPRRRFRDAVCLALTATATPRVREDIRRLLRIDESGTFVASFDRPNLHVAAEPREDSLGQTLAFLERHRDESGIIYCATRRQVNELAAELSARRWPALPYHAGLEDGVRQRNQDRFIRDDPTVMVATIAFGMGINKANVRFVLHYHLPKDLESYYQEIGRAGRDGLPADCLLLHHRRDALTIRHFIRQGAPAERPGRQARLEAMLQFAQTPGCRRQPLLTYFGEPFDAECGHCDNCRRSRQPLDHMDGTAAARKFLACVQSTGEIFGPAHVIQVLRGCRARRILERRHERLPEHGTGREFNAREWRELARQFLAQGLLEQDAQFGSLRLTPRGRRVLEGDKVWITPPGDAPEEPAPGDQPATHDRALFESLRRLRRQLAGEAGLPPYAIFSDRALIEMATNRPADERQFLTINGVGLVKLRNYGPAFLRCIREHSPGQPPALDSEGEKGRP